MIKRVVPLLFLILIMLSLSLVLTTSTDVDAQATGSWTANFYNNTTYSGTPAYSRTYSAGEMASLNFGTGSPAASVTVDNFSAIFISTQVLQAGTYNIRVFADDQAELRINGQLIIDINAPGSQSLDYTVPITATYQMEIRYIELTASAAIQIQFNSGIFGTTLTPIPTVPPTRTPLPAIPPGALTATVIRASVLNVRDAPSLGGNYLGRILRGETYAVVGRDADARWFLLQLGGYQGWSYGYYLFINGNEFNPPIVSGASLLGLAGQTDYGVRGQSFATLRLREGPSVATRQIGRVTWGAFLPIVGRTSGSAWYQTVWKGTVGWVYAPFVEIVEGDINNVPVKPG